MSGDHRSQDHSGHDGVGFHPVRVAILLSSTFLAFSSLYIWLSGRIAAARSATVAELEHIETIKGIVFVLSCSALMFLLTWILMRRVARTQEQVLAHRQALVVAERRALAGVLASTLAHDMNNILTVGVATADLLRHQQGMTPEQAEMVGDLVDTFDRLTSITRRLSSLGRDGLRADLVPGDLSAVIREEMGFALRHARLRRCRINLRTEDSIPLLLSPCLLQQMLMNLLLNAAEAAGQDGAIEVHVRREGEQAVIEVHDSGPGIPEQQRDRIFEAFYTTKPKGGGLGLLSVKAAAQAHRGRITILKSHLGGACFRVEFPAQPVTATEPLVPAT